MYGNTAYQNTAAPTADNEQPAVQPQPAAPLDDIQLAKQSEAEFMQEIAQQPKPALTPGADVPPPDSSAAPASEGTPAKDIKDFFGDFLTKKKPAADPVQAEPTAQATTAETVQTGNIFPKEEAPQAEEKTAGPSAEAVQDNYLFIEELKNTAAAALLAMRSGTPAKNWTLDSDQVARLAKAAAKMKVKFIEEMDGGTQYLALNAMIYVPMVARAEQLRAQHVRNAQVRQQPAPANDAMPDFFADKPNAGPVANGSKATRTRFDIHNDGTYMYTRTIPGQGNQYLKKGDSRCEPVDLTDIPALKSVILRAGDWQKVAAAIKVSHQWMADRGLNTNNPD